MKEKKLPMELTEEERLQQEQRRETLMKENQKTVSLVVVVLWGLAMVCWGITLVLDIVNQAGVVKTLFHGVAAALSLVCALLRLRNYSENCKNAQQAEEPVDAIPDEDAP